MRAIRLPKWLTRRLPCDACKQINKESLQIKWPIEVFLNENGANYICHKCGRSGPIDREMIPRM